MNHKAFSVLKTLKFLLLAITGLPLLYLIFAAILSFLPLIPENHDCIGSKPLWVGSNGVHLNINVPVEYFKPEIQTQLGKRHSTRFYSFGWGDREFYMNTPEWADLKAGTAFRALFTKSPSAMHLRYYRSRYKHWIKLDLCEHQWLSLENYILSSFKYDAQGNIMEIPESGYGPDDTFFEGTGHYSLYMTSNNWVNEGLQAADVKTSLWSPFPFGVLFHIK